jgi:hypothetical protein
LRGPGGLLLIRLPALLGLAFERRASVPGPRRGVAQKRRERQQESLELGVPATVSPVRSRGAGRRGFPCWQ